MWLRSRAEVILGVVSITTFQNVYDNFLHLPTHLGTRDTKRSLYQLPIHMMVFGPLEDTVPVSTLPVDMEVGIRVTLTFNPVKSDNRDVSVADNYLTKHIEAVVYMFPPDGRRLS